MKALSMVKHNILKMGVMHPLLMKLRWCGENNAACLNIANDNANNTTDIDEHEKSDNC